MKDERLIKARNTSLESKKPVIIKSIDIKDTRGDILLTDISQIPLFNSNGDFQGFLMVIEDVSETVIAQAELRRKNEELERIDSKFKEMNNRLQIANKGQIAVDDNLIKLREEKLKELEHINTLVENKQRELESLGGSINLKTEELDGVSIKLQENKSNLEMIENELVKKTELESIIPPQEGLTNNWKEKFELFDEIDKFLGINDDTLKTKKIDHGTEIEKD